MAISSDVRSLDQVNYSTGIHKVLLLAALLIAFCFAFLANFPIEKKIEALVRTQIANVPGCLMNFERLRFEFFLPKVVLTDVNLPGSCFGGSKPLKMRQMALHFQGPSFAPLGLALKMSMELNGIPLSINYAAGVNSQVFNIQEENFPIQALSEVLGSIPKMEGNVSMNAKVALGGQQIQEMKILVESQNIEVLPQTLSDIKIPRLAIGNLLLKVESEGPRKLMLREFVIGKMDAPIRGKFSGTIDLVSGSMAFSPINIKGEAALSPDFLNSFPILNLMLPQFPQKDGFYQIKLGGTLGNPRPQP
jgi:type II secretion system protein N